MNSHCDMAWSFAELLQLSGRALWPLLGCLLIFTGTARTYGQTGCTFIPISVGQSVNASLSAADCRSPVRGDTHYADRYSLNASAGAQVSISLSSTDFDTYLYVIGPAGSSIARDDDGGGGSNSRIPALSGVLTLPTSGSYLIEVTSFSADRTGNYTLLVGFQPSGCNYAIAPASQLFSITGGTGMVNVTVGSGCAWQALNNANWISIASGSSGIGNGVVSYSVAPNAGLNPRTATLVIAGLTFNITQSGCVSILPSGQSFVVTGGIGNINVTGASNCEWTATSDNSWITITGGGGGSGNGTVLYSVAASTSFAVRSGTITIAGQIFTVTQAALVCPTTSLTIGQTTPGALSSNDCRSPSRGDAYLADRYLFYASAGTQVTVGLNSSEFDTYLYLLGPVGTVVAQDDDGAGASNSRIPLNTGLLTLTVGGAYLIEVTSFSPNRTGTYSLSLSGELSPCTYSIAPASQSFSAAGGTGGVNVTTPEGCAWMGASNNNWITITTGATGNGNGFVSFNVAGNTGASARIGTMTIAGQTFTVMQGGVSQLARVVRVVSSSGAPGSTVNISIELLAQGNENTVGFTLTYDPAVLTFTGAVPGEGALAALQNLNTSQISQGRLGALISLPTGQMFVPGTRQILVVSLLIGNGAVASLAAVGFGDEPFTRSVLDVNLNPLSADYVSGTVAITPGFEGDVAPRPVGDGTLNNADWVEAGLLSTGLETPVIGSEYQRADCAPRNTRGDGRLTVADWVQVRRYAMGLDAVTPAGGPTEPMSTTLATSESDAPSLRDSTRASAESDSEQKRIVRLVKLQFERAKGGALAIEIDAQGNENALGFSVDFDPRQLRFIRVAPGRAASDVALNIDVAEAANGHLGFALVLPPEKTFAPGTHQLALITFAAISDSEVDSIAVGFGDNPSPREIVDIGANVLPARYQGETSSSTNKLSDESSQRERERSVFRIQVRNEMQAWKGYPALDDVRFAFDKEEEYVTRRQR